MYSDMAVFSICNCLALGSIPLFSTLRHVCSTITSKGPVYCVRNVAKVHLYVICVHVYMNMYVYMHLYVHVYLHMYVYYVYEGCERERHCYQHRGYKTHMFKQNYFWLTRLAPFVLMSTLHFVS